MLLSGFAGISYEVLYGRILGNLIGDQFAVSTAILMTFLLGIGAGAVFAHRLWGRLWLIEFMIGLCALAFAFGTPGLDAFLYVQSQFIPSGLEGAILLCVLLLIIPAFLIGCSLPLFAGYLSRLADGLVFARAYAVYNLGAGLTALLIEFLLIRHFGIRGSLLLVAGINGLVALGLRVGYADLGIRETGKATNDRSISMFPKKELAALVLASVGSAVFQLFMIRVAELFLGPFRETFAIVLSIVLFGIAAGAALVKRYRFSFSTVLRTNLAGLTLLLVGLQAAVYFYASLYDVAAQSYYGAAVLKWVFLLLLMGLPSVTFGAAIPALLTRQQNVARESGILLCISSIANAAGFFLMSFVLHRYLDYGVQLLTVAGFSGLALLLCRKIRWQTAAVVLSLLLAMAGAHRFVWDENLLYLSYDNFRGTQKLIEARAETVKMEKFKGHQDVFAIIREGGRPKYIR